MPRQQKNMGTSRKHSVNSTASVKKTKHKKRSSSPATKSKKNKENKISVHVSNIVAGKWKLISPQTVDHVHGIITATAAEVVTTVPKKKKSDIAEKLAQFSGQYLMNLKKQKVPAKKSEPYTQLRKNTARLCELLRSSDNRIDKLETDIEDCEKEIEEIENFLENEVVESEDVLSISQKDDELKT